MNLKLEDYQIQAIRAAESNKNFGWLKYGSQGRTFANCIVNLRWCFRNPNRWIKIQDHYDTQVANIYMFRMLCDIVQELHLTEFMEFKPNQKAIRVIVDLPQSSMAAYITAKHKFSLEAANGLMWLLMCIPGAK